MDVTIDNLPDVSLPVVDADIVHVSRSGDDYKSTAETLKDYIYDEIKDPIYEEADSFPAQTTLNNDDAIAIREQGTPNVNKKVDYSVLRNQINEYVNTQIDSLTQKTIPDDDDDFLIREQGTPNVSKRIAYSILKNYISTPAISKVDGSVASSLSIDSTDPESSYYIDVQENQKFPVSLDAPSTVPGKRIKIFYDSTNYGTLPITSTGANIRLTNGVLYTTICLFTNGECVELESDGTYWNVVNGWWWAMDSSYISRSDWTAVSPGTIEIILNDSTGFAVWDIATESTSGYRVIVAGISGNSLYCWRADDGSGGVAGFFTSARTLSVVSGGGASDTISANTKNVDSYIYTGFNKRIKKSTIDFEVSEDGTENLSMSLIDTTQTANYGITLHGYDLNNMEMVTQTNGFLYIKKSDHGLYAIDTEDWYYRYRS